MDKTVLLKNSSTKNFTVWRQLGTLSFYRSKILKFLSIRTYWEKTDEHSDSWTKALEMVFNSSDLSTATYIRNFLKKKQTKNLAPTLPNFFQAVPLNTEFIFFGLSSKCAVFRQCAGGINMPFWLQVTLKDARSVSLYPYNQSQILQYVKYTK